MMVATITHTWTDTPAPVRALKAAQLAALRVLGGHVILESIGQDMFGQYRITMPTPKTGVFKIKQVRNEITIQDV